MEGWLGGRRKGWQENVYNSNIKNIFQMPPANLNRMKGFPYSFQLLYIVAQKGY